jgi:hypothetical protein
VNLLVTAIRMAGAIQVLDIAAKDAIVHNIHLRVFRHIKRLAEQQEALASRR